MEIGRKGELQEVGNGSWDPSSCLGLSEEHRWEDMLLGGGVRFAHLGSWDQLAGLSGIPNEGASALHFTSARQSTGEAASETDRLSLAK